VRSCQGLFPSPLSPSLCPFFISLSSAARSLNLDSSVPPEDTLKGEFSVNGCKVNPLTFDLTGEFLSPPLLLTCFEGKDHSFQLVLNDAEVIVLAAQSEAEKILVRTRRPPSPPSLPPHLLSMSCSGWTNSQGRRLNEKRLSRIFGRR
jgi:hypothetical protein